MNETTITARIGLFAHQGLVFPIMRLFPDITGSQLSWLWRIACEQDHESAAAVFHKQESQCDACCGATMKWKDPAPAIIIVMDPRLPEASKDRLQRKIDDFFHATHYLIPLPMRGYQLMQGAVRIESDFPPFASLN